MPLRYPFEEPTRSTDLQLSLSFLASAQELVNDVIMLINNIDLGQMIGNSIFFEDTYVTPGDDSFVYMKVKSGQRFPLGTIRIQSTYGNRIWTMLNLSLIAQQKKWRFWIFPIPSISTGTMEINPRRPPPSSSSRCSNRRTCSHTIINREKMGVRVGECVYRSIDRSLYMQKTIRLSLFQGSVYFYDDID